MAADWIKMRTDLIRSPKVARIASALHADRLRVIGGLHAVWSLFDEQSPDGFINGYTLEIVDDLIGWPGFAAEMATVVWLVVDGETLAIPEFDTHNGAPAKRRAMESERKKKARNLSASDADKKRTREREDVVPKGTTRESAARLFVPEELKLAWAVWNRHRGASKGWTALAKERNLAKLVALAGDNPALAMDIVDQSIERTWTGLFPIKDDGRPAPTPQPTAKTAKQAMAPSESKLANKLGYAKQQYDRGEFGTGMAGKQAYEAACSQIRREHQEPPA